MEAGAISYLTVMLLVGILAFVFDGHQVAAMFGNLYQSFLSVPLGFFHGIYNLLLSLVQSVWNYIAGGAANIGNTIYRNTVGRL